MEENYEISRDELKKAGTLALLTEVLEDCDPDDAEIPILQQTNPDFIKFQNFALWALKRANSANLKG